MKIIFEKYLIKTIHKTEKKFVTMILLLIYKNNKEHLKYS